MTLAERYLAWSIRIHDQPGVDVRECSSCRHYFCVYYGVKGKDLLESLKVAMVRDALVQ